jgi:ectoine hydroxylase-related dioxygenase (phytanoyl-CoA dioxygenase family)
MRSFFVANELFADKSALKKKFDDDGYLYLKGLIDKSKLLELRKQILDICGRHHWLKSGADPMRALTGTFAKVEGEEDYLTAYDDIQKLEDFHALAHDANILSIMKSLLGETAFPHPLSIARLMFPHVPEWTTPPHQDFRNNQGTEDLYACWMPLSDCPIELGNISILRGSHKFGLLPIEFALGPGHRQAILDEKLKSLDWVGGNFELGDAIIFHSLTVHRSLPNLTDSMRLSVDYRYQREGDALMESCLLPHFQRLSWETIYTHWQRDELKYYWKKKSFKLVSGNPNINDLPEEHLKDAVKQTKQFHRKRIDAYNDAASS